MLGRSPSLLMLTPAIELLSVMEVGKVPMVSEDLNLLHCAFKEVVLLV